MSEGFTFPVGPNDEVTVKSWEQLRDWIQHERQEWEWLNQYDSDLNRHNVATAVHDSWNRIYNSVVQIENQGHIIGTVLPEIGALTTETTLVSFTTKGTTVLDILRDAGPEAAAFAYGLLARQINAARVTSPNELLGAILSVMPHLSKSVDWSEKLKQERNKYKSATRSMMERVDNDAKIRGREIADLVERSKGIGRRIFNLRRRHWANEQASWRALADQSLLEIKNSGNETINNINNVRSAFEEFMKLKAPVEYWKQKADDHRIKEKSARTNLLIFFPVTIIILTIAFVKAADFIVAWGAAVDTLPSSLYVVISGGLLLVSTLAFWIGRLLTKLYLSEHHLRNDAEERATMTTTYLALNTEGLASDADRQIILTALFRATPDGIVKEEGPGDASIQGLIARLATR